MTTQPTANAPNAKQNLINVFLASGAFGSDPIIVTGIVNAIEGFIGARIAALAINVNSGVLAGDAPLKTDQR